MLPVLKTVTSCRKMSVNTLWPSDVTWRHISQSRRIAGCLMAPNHYLSQCRVSLAISLQLSLGSDFTASAQATFLYDEFEKYNFEITAAHEDMVRMCGTTAVPLLPDVVWKRGDQIILNCVGTATITVPWSAGSVALKTEPKHPQLHYYRNLTLRILRRSFAVANSGMAIPTDRVLYQIYHNLYDYRH